MTGFASAGARSMRCNPVSASPKSRMPTTDSRLSSRSACAEARSSGDDLFSEMMQVEIDGDRIGAEELVFLSGELASAGVDTTRAQLPLILNAFLDHPAEWDKLRADPGLDGRASGQDGNVDGAFSGCWRHARTFSGPRSRNGNGVRKAARFAG